jgi:hypothetical protein
MDKSRTPLGVDPPFQRYPHSQHLETLSPPICHASSLFYLHRYRVLHLERIPHAVGYCSVIPPAIRRHRMVWRTLIDSVNGRVESWRSCEHSPATFAPHLSFLGIVMVGKVDRPASDIQGSIFNKVWKEQDSRRGKDQYPPTDEYVCWALLHLCNEKTITLPPLVTNNFSGHFAERLSKLRKRSRSKVTQYLIIPIVEGDVVVGRTQV